MENYKDRYLSQPKQEHNKELNKAYHTVDEIIKALKDVEEKIHKICGVPKSLYQK